MNIETVFEFGEKVKERNAGLVGVIVAVVKWQNGCVRYVIQPQVVKDGKPAEQVHCDEPDLISLDNPKKRVSTIEPGGPRPAPTQHGR
jgi:hypothetical protein